MTDRPRVAMFVMNPCHADARVRKEAQTLGEAGYEVRVFALGNQTWPTALISERGFTIQRLEVVSSYQRIVGWLGRVYRRETKLRSWRTYPWPVKVLLLPVAVVVMLVRSVLTGSVRLARRAAQAATGPIEPQPDRAESCEPHDTTDKVVPDGSPADALDGSHPTPRGSRRLLSIAVWGARRTYRTLRRGVRQVLRATYLVVLRFVRTRILVLHRPSVYLEYWKAAGAAAAAWDPDVVHAHDLNALPAAMRAADGRTIPVVYDSHELWRHRNRVTRFHPIGRAFDAIQERRLMRRVDLVITVGGCIETWLQRAYRLPSERTVVLRNVPWRRDPTGSAPGLRDLAGLADERIVLYTGRVTSGRGLEEAIDALPSLPADVQVVMLGYGDAEYIGSLQARARDNDVFARLHLVPPVPSEQVPAVASQADAALVAIQPLCLSYRYALPNKLFEAIQAGVPVVASDLPEIRTIVDHYEVGTLFPIGDAEGFAGAVASVLSDREVYRAGTDDAAAQLCWENEREVLIAAYHRLAPAAVARDLSRPDALA